jgi:hypothetical protein
MVEFPKEEFRLKAPLIRDPEPVPNSSIKTWFTITLLQEVVHVL